MTRWLVFLDGCYPDAWLRLDDGVVTARGADLAALPPEATDIVAVVPGTAVVIHWVQLPALAPAQTRAAARLLGAEVSGGAIDTMHLAIGMAGPDAKRPLALVARADMAAWLASLATAGLDADCVVALPLLVVPGDVDAPAAFSAGGVGNVHAPGLAFAAEPTLVDVILAGAALTSVDQAAFEAGLASMLSPGLLNLRQGDFGPAQPPLLDERRVRRLALFGIAAAGLWLAGEVATVWRDGRAADRVEAQVAEAARAVLPRGTAIDAPRAQVAAYAERVGAAGSGFTTLAAPLLTAVRDRPGLLVTSMRYTPDNGLAATVVLPSPSDRQALADAMAQANVAVTLGEAHDEAGKPVAEILVRPR